MLASQQRGFRQWTKHWHVSYIKHRVFGPTFLTLPHGHVHSNVCFTDNLGFYPFQNFIYNEGSTKIRVAPNNLTETDFCIDFGTNLGANGQGLKIWECYEGLPQQQLYITDDRHIAVENRPNGGQCVDVRAESGPEPVKPYGIRKQVQSWECSYGNPNQASRIGPL